MTEDARSDLPLAAEFPPASREQWLKLVEGVLKGAPFDKKLTARTYDGMRIEPLYARDADARPVAARTPGAPWQVMARVDHPDPAAANAEALHDLANGATGLGLVFAGSAGAYGYGLDASEATLERTLDGVYLDAGVAIELQLSAAAREAPDRLAALVKRRGVAPAAINIRFGLNPIGALAGGGQLPAPWNALAKRFAGIVTGLAAHGFAGPFAVADGRAIHAAGGSEAQELAFVLAVAVAYLRALEAGGVALDEARRMVFFRLAADADQFLTIAKFRALRRLWARVEEACGLDPKPAFVSAETAWRMMTKRDPAVNMLRTTVAAFSAGIAGADAIAVLPYTSALGLPDRLARRIARNTQLILMEESNLARVADPAAGSGGMEALTHQLNEAAWRLFQEIEAADGAVTALEQGLIQRHVAATRAEREAAVARRKDAITGTSEFPHLEEMPVAVLDVPIVATPPSGPAAVTADPLPSIRLAEPFEALRDASDRMLAATGSRPKVFLANLGTLSDFTARASFAKNFFEAGGIEAVSNDGFALASPLPVGERSARASAPGEGALPSSDAINPSPGPAPAVPDRPLPPGEVKKAGRETATDLAALIAAFKASGAALVCLCSSDKVYETKAVEAAKGLAHVGATHIYLAGRPQALEPALREAGVTNFIFTGCDVLAALRAAHQALAG